MKEKKIKIRPELIPEQLSTASPERYECEKCGLYKKARHPFLEFRVPKYWDGFGLFIGEGPDKIEDKKGRIWSGPRGKLLKLLRGLANYKKEQFAFVNSIRCRLPEDVTPTSAQLRFCKPFLLQAIQTLKPKNIVLLGRTALTAARNKADLSVVKARGREIQIVGSYKQVPTVATYHPDAILHGKMELRDTIVNDLKGMKRKSLEYPTKRVPRKVNILGFDTEFSPDKKLLTVGIASEKEAIASDWPGDVISLYSKVRRADLLVGHNLPGDLDYLVGARAAKNTWLRGDDIRDSLLLARLHDENKERGGYGLENLLCSEYRVKPWKEPTASQFKKSPDARLWTPHDRTERCRLDAWASLKLASLYTDDRKDLSLLSHRIEMTLYRLGLAGAAVLNGRFLKLGMGWQRKATKHAELVTRVAFKYGMNDFQPSNREHLRELLFSKMHLKKMGYTKKAHKLVVDKGVLEESLKLTKRKSKRRVIKNLMIYLKNSALATMCFGGKSKEKSIDYLKTPFPKDPKLSLLHNWINPLGAKTGRRSGGGTDLEISHGGRNPQNWTPKIRPIIVSRWYKKGGRIASLDFKSLEPLIMAWKIQLGTKRESRLLYYFEGEGPGYIGLAKDLLKLTVKKGSTGYKAIKAIYLGLGYGMDDWKLAYDLWFKVGLRYSEYWDEHVKKTRKVRKRYFKMFPEVREYHRHQEKELEKTQQIVVELGMIRHLPHFGKEMVGFKHLINQAINLPMQYMASLVTGSAMVDYERALLKEHHLTYVEWHESLLNNPYDLPASPIINEIHDEILQDLHPKTGERDLEILHSSMLEVPTLRKMIPEFKVKLTVNETVEESWV